MFVEKVSPKGIRYSVFEAEAEPVARIPDAYQHSIIYLYASRQDAEQRVNFGGTGFLLGVPSVRHPKWRHAIAVTNRHVVTGNPSSDPPDEPAPVIGINTFVGNKLGVDCIELETKNWIYEKSQDLAVTVLSLAGEHHAHLLPSERLLTLELLQEHKIGLGDDVFMLGRFINKEGIQCNTPSARFGNLAMMPFEPAWHETNQPPKQESFLVDIKSIGGYSGSPVFLPFDQLFQQGRINFLKPTPEPMRMDPFLLGIEWGYIEDHRGLNTGMSGVVPAWRLAELLNSGRVRAATDQQDELIGRHYSGGTALTTETGNDEAKPQGWGS